MNETDFSKVVSDIKVGDIVDTIVSNTTSFGIFVSVKNAEGFIHLSELSWDRLEGAENYYKPGEKVRAQVIGIDKDAKRVNLSVKRLTIDPFEETAKDYSIDRRVKGKITKISSLGISLELEGDIEGLIKKEKVPPSSNYEVGQTMEAVVSEVDSRRHRIILVPVLKEKPIGYR